MANSGIYLNLTADEAASLMRALRRELALAGREWSPLDEQYSADLGSITWALSMALGGNRD